MADSSLGSPPLSDLKARLDDLKIDRPPEARRRPAPWIPLAVVVLLAVVAFWWLRRPQTVEVRTAVARSERAAGAQTVLNASGYVTARRQATVSAKVTGKVVEVLIEEGMQVAEGQVLARLDDANVAAALRLAEARLRAARAAAEEIRVLLEEAQLERRRAESLAGAGVGSRRELDRARAQADSLAARLENQRREAVVAERAVSVERQALEDTVIRAPFDGVVVAKSAQPGEMISPISAGGGFTRTGIGTLVDMTSLEIEVDVNEAYIDRVSPGQAVEAALDAYPDWRIPCRVIAIIPTADRQRATVRVRVGFDELDPRILPDMGIKVAFQAPQREATAAPAGVTVPAAAVRSEDGRHVVFVVVEGRAERRAVTLGGGADGAVRVLGGLVAGERVVVDPVAELADGTRVREVGE